MSAGALLKTCGSFNVHHTKPGEHAPWEHVNFTMMNEEAKVQWKGVRILYLEVLKGPLHVISFARDSSNPAQPQGQAQVQPGGIVRKVVELLSALPSAPSTLFAEDVAASGVSEEVSATRDFRMLLQAQLAGVLLSIILQLSLLGDSNLKLQLHDAGAEQLLCKLALGKSTHYHPELDPLATLMQNSRPDVHNKMIELYKLIPLAVSCIYKATGTQDNFMQHLEDLTLNMKIVMESRNRGLAAKLRDQLTFIQSIDAGIAAPNIAAVQHSIYQDVASIVTAAQKQYLKVLQHAYRSAISGYSKQQAGNCLYWLGKEPQDAAAALRDASAVPAVNGHEDTADDQELMEDTSGKSSAKNRRACRSWPMFSVALLATFTFLTGVTLGGYTNKNESHN